MTCVLMIILLMVCSVLQQSDSAFSSELTNGSDFYMGFLKNFDRKGQVKLEIVVSTSSPTPVAFRVHSAARNQLLGSGIVPALSELEVTIPLEYMLRTSRHAERHKGIHVVTNDSEVSIVAIASNRITSFTGSTSAYRIFPYQEVAGTAQYEYFAISIGAVSGQGLLSEFLLVGNENDTTITIFPTNETGSLHLPRDAQDGDAMIEVIPGDGHSVILNQLQTLLVTKTVDLTGTRIVSNKPITVLSGHECGNVPHDVPKCDHVGIHVRPTSDWGKNFLLIPFLGRPSGQWIKIVVAEDNTLISRTCSGSLSSEMLFPSPGDSYFFKTTPFMSCYVQSNKPLLVAQLSQGGTLDGIGDPAMLLISPIEQYVNRVSLLALNADLFSHSYITITTSGDHFGPANVLLDGMPVIGDWNIVISQQSYIIGYGCRLQVSPGHHTVEHTNDDGRLSVVVYGFDNELRHAYGYSGSVSSRTDRPAFKPILLPGADTPTPSPSTAMHSSTLHPVLSTDLTTSIISTSLSLSTSSSVPLSSTTVVIEPALSSSYSLFTEYLTETDILLPSATIMLESAGFLNESTTPLLLAIAALTAVLAATTMTLFVVLHQRAGKSSPPSSNTNGSTVNNTVINMPADSASEEQAAATLAGSDTEEDPQQTGNNADSTERHEPATDSASSAVENGLQQNEATSNDLQERENNSQRSENDSRRSGTSDNEEDSDQEDSDEENEEEVEESDGGERDDEGDVDSCLAMKRALMASPPPTPLRSREPTPAEDGENEEDEENGEEDAEDGEQEEGDKDVEEEEEGAESEEQEDDSEQEEEDKDSEVEEGVGNDEETQTVELQEDDDHSEAADGEEMLSDKDEHGDTKSEDNSKDSDPKEAAATSAYPPSRGQPVDSGRCTCSDCQSQYYGTSYRQYPHQPYMYQNQYFNPYSTQSRLQPPPSRRQYSDWYSYY